MKTILLGEAPPRSRLRDMPDSLPFSGASGRRFSEMLGVDVTQAFETRNLLSEWPGAARKGSRFPMAEAKKAALVFVKGLEPERRIILVGSRVAKALRMDYLPQLEWRSVEFRWSLGVGKKLLVVGRVPHSSGVNQDWNDPETHERVRAFLTEELRRSGAAA